MSAVSDSTTATASNRLQAGLQLVAGSLAKTPLDVLAREVGKDDTQMSRIRSNQLGANVNDVVKMIYAAGMKVVSAEKICVDRARYEAMVSMVAAAMSDEQTVRRLTWDE